jgi:hypothetical protein
VELGCGLLDETNSGWMAKSKVVLDYKLSTRTKSWMGDLPAEEEHQGA